MYGFSNNKAPYSASNQFLFVIKNWLYFNFSKHKTIIFLHDLIFVFSHVSLGQYWEKRNNEKILSKVGVWKKTIMGVVYRRGWIKTFRTLWTSTRGLFSTVRVVSLTMYILTINFLKHLLIKFLIQLEHIRKDLWVSVQIVPKL